MTMVMTKVMPHHRPNNRAIPREEIRERIFAAAIALFREQGFEETTVEDIARLAKVAKGTVFNFFPSKGAILLHYYEAIDAKFAAKLAELSADAARESLVKFYAEAERLLRAEGSLIDMIFRQIAADATLQNTDQDSGERDRNELVEFFRACRKRGTLSAKVDPAIAGQIVSDLWSATCQEWLRSGKRTSLKSRLAAKLDAVFAGFAPAARSVAAIVALVAALACTGQPSRAADPPPLQPAALIGLYEDSLGDVAVTRFDEFGDATFFIDYASGRAGPLEARASGFAIGAEMKDAKLTAGSIVPTGQGAIDVNYDGVHRTLRRVELRREQFHVANGDVVLAGELVSRADLSPKGAVIIVHGSNDSPRTVYGPWVSYLAARGWSVAVYDKRGSGQSTGDWRKGGFGELASDTRAVARYLHATPAFAGKKIGLLGVSQAGWVMPLAAENGEFDFIVSLAGAAVTPAEQTIELTQLQLEAYGFAKDEIDRALDYYRLDLAVTTGREPWGKVEAAYNAAMARHAEWLLAPPEPADSPSRAFLGRIADFDVGPHWAKVRAPVLALFGGRDLIVPVEPNRKYLTAMLAANADTATRIVTLPDVNHVGMIAKTGTIAEYGELDHFDPQYFRTFGDWLDAIAAR
jgi:AcrR family transcriptional regulator/pimeloyl-ACP methyl ester carboxylesterase